MIDAYYSLGCDSSNLFDNTKIAANADYKKYLNKYNVIHLDISSFWDFHKKDLIESIKERVYDDFKEIYAESLNYNKDIHVLLNEIYHKTTTPFVIIIDEWDCVIRNSDDKELVHSYLQFLHHCLNQRNKSIFSTRIYYRNFTP